MDRLQSDGGLMTSGKASLMCSGLEDGSLSFGRKKVEAEHQQEIDWHGKERRLKEKGAFLDDGLRRCSLKLPHPGMMLDQRR